MAKAKKKESLTPEERLQAALVPESEQPYPVPANWCWTRIGDILRLQAGKNISASKISKNRSQEASFPCFGGNGVRGYVERYNHDGEFPIIGRQGALCGNVNWASGKFYATEHAVVVECSSIISKRWAYRILFSMNLNQYATATAQPGLSVAVINQVPIALPPAQEQQRIVDRIESLFAKLDEAKQKAQDALDSFETRKAAILHKAFTGELTAQWRKKHSIGMESWETKKLSEVSTLQTGLMKGKNYSGKTVMLPYLRVANVQDGFLNLSEIKEIEVSEELIDRYSLKNGDVLFTEGGDYDKLGRGTVWQGQIKNCLHQNHVFVVRPQADVLSPYFLSYQAGSRYGKQYFLKCSKQTTNLASINSTQLKGFPVLMPTIEEQAQIVLLIDDLLAKEQQAREAAEGVLEQIDLMKKAILARAFRGELGTNDPREESAVELVKTII